jgi:hypothetical protein
MYAYKHHGKKETPGDRQTEPAGDFDERRAQQNAELFENNKRTRTNHAERRYEAATCLHINSGKVISPRHGATAMWDNAGTTRKYNQTKYNQTQP